MNVTGSEQELAGRRARARRLALVLGAVAVLFYVGFIAFTGLTGHGG